MTLVRPIAGIALLLAALGAAPGAARAQSLGLGLNGDDDNKPMNIEADQGIEWQQNNRVYIARGNVKVTRGQGTLYADTLIAHYRPMIAGAPVAQAVSSTDKTPDTDLGGSTEVYRLEAEGHVRIASPTQTVYGDHATYDLDQALVVVTGKDLKLETTTDIVTARDSLEWYDRRQLAVARGDALATREGKRLRGDVLTAEMVKGANDSSHISRIDAHGHVIVASLDQVARGDNGVYNVDTGIATLIGGVTVTKADNELRGQYAVVDLNNNVSRLLSAPPDAKLTEGTRPRVQGLMVPRSKPDATPAR